MFLFLFCKKLSIFQTTLEFSSFLCMTMHSYRFFSHTSTRRPRGVNLLGVSRLFSTSRFCSDVTIQEFFLCTLACHAECIYYSYMRTHSYMKSSTKCFIPDSFAFPTKFTKSQVNILVLPVSVWIFRMSTSWHTGWKVLNCLTNTTEIIGKKGKHGKLGFLFQVLFLGHWTRLFQFLLLCKYRMLLQ